MTKKATVTKRIRVPSLPVLAHIMHAIAKDYKVAFSEEMVQWCTRHADYIAEVGNHNPPYVAWHQRAREMNDPPPLHDPHIDAEYCAGYDAAMTGISHSKATSIYWRDGWTDGMRYRGKVTRVN